MTPYLDDAIVGYALRIPSKYKIRGEYDKYVLRKVGKNLGLDVWNRKKKAAQYGSNFDKAISKLSKGVRVL